MVHGRQRHVVAYLREFLFDEGQARQPVKSLSGGERNRLLLARLFAQPCDLIVLDEPTNDLDMETLDLLVDVLDDCAGTLILVSHDRDFLDRPGDRDHRARRERPRGRIRRRLQRLPDAAGRRPRTHSEIGAPP